MVLGPPGCFQGEESSLGWQLLLGRSPSDAWWGSWEWALLFPPLQTSLLVLQYQPQQPDDGLLQLLTLPGRRGGVKEGIFLVPSRVVKWEFTLFRLKCTQPFFDIFLVIMVSWSKVLENLRESCLTFFISGLNDKIWPLTVDVFLDIFMSLVKKRQNICFFSIYLLFHLIK